MNRETEEQVVTAVGLGLAALTAAFFIPATRRRILRSLERVQAADVLAAGGVAAAQAALTAGGLEALRRARDRFLDRA
jgi:aspartate oxidase